MDPRTYRAAGQPKIISISKNWPRLMLMSSGHITSLVKRFICITREKWELWKYLLLCNVPPSPPHRPRRTRWRPSLFHILFCLVSCSSHIFLSCVPSFLAVEKLGEREKGCLIPSPTDTLGDLSGEKILMQEHIVVWFPALTTWEPVAKTQNAVIPDE